MIALVADHEALARPRLRAAGVIVFCGYILCFLEEHAALDRERHRDDETGAAPPSNSSSFCRFRASKIIASSMATASRCMNGYDLEDVCAPYARATKEELRKAYAPPGYSTAWSTSRRCLSCDRRRRAGR